MTLPRPQRIGHDSPPGSLLKRVGAASPAAPRKDAGDRDASHMALIRLCPCLKCGLDPAGVAAHLRMNSGTFNKRQAMQKKPSGKWTTPLCRACHTDDPDAQHKMGEAEFWHMLGINPFLACQRLHEASGDLVRMRAVAFQIIGERSKR